MADDLTDALRAIIEPMKDELISAAQAHYLASIREELADAHRHTERALELISDLITTDMEPHWNIQSGTPNLMMWARQMVRNSPPPDEPPGGITRDTPRPGEVWVFSQGSRWPKPVVAQVDNPEPGQPVEIAMVVKGVSAGEYFKFNALDDPMPVRRLGYGAVFRPEDVTPEGSPAGTPFTPYTNTDPAYQRMTEETDTI